jgi:hypothetical protein
VSAPRTAGEAAYLAWWNAASASDTFDMGPWDSLFPWESEAFEAAARAAIAFVAGPQMVGGAVMQPEESSK